MKTLLFILESILGILVAGVISFILALLIYTLLFNGGMIL